MAATTVLVATVCPPGPPRPGWVAIADGIIQEVGEGRAPSGALDLGARVLAPGYVDLQVNGFADIDFATASPEQWTRACARLAVAGTTAFCPTFVSTDLDEYDELLAHAAVARDAAAAASAARILGVHLEGPFLGGAPGAHRPEVLTPADAEWITAVIERSPALVRMVTLAPEADAHLATTRALHALGVVVALGHSTATHAEALAAADAGASVVTHLFNGMGPLHHREPGLVGAALDDERLTPTLIADLVHVHAAALRLAIERKPNVALVSDAVALGGLVEADGAAWTDDGRLAGATTLLDRAVTNVVGLGIALERAIEMASTIPALILGLTDRGHIAAGARADLIALDPISFAVDQVWIGGAPFGDGHRSSVAT